MRSVKMKSVIGCAVMAWALTACSGAEEAGPVSGGGSVQLQLNADAAFTRAVTISDYQNTGNYTVQILDENGSPAVDEFLYSAWPGQINLANGSYTLKAFYGTESAASRDGFRVEGSQAFQVQGEPVTVEVTCRPTCGKVQVQFDAAMSEYFSDYYVTYTTEALDDAGETAVWARNDTEPWYLAVNQAGEEVKAVITAVRLSDGSRETVERTYMLQPNRSWTLSIAPEVNSGDEDGDLGISITVDETTNDHEVDIDVPSDWV